MAGQSRWGRREFLRAGVLAGASLVLGGDEFRPTVDPVFGIEIKDRRLSFEMAATLAVKWDRVYDLLPKVGRGVTEADSLAWTHEIVPFFEINGIVPEIRWPTSESFVFFENDIEHLWAYGATYCSWEEMEVILNGRFEEPLSWWSKDYFKFLLAKIHELAHVQQGVVCWTAGFLDGPKIEVAASTAAVEVAASMALEGSPWMFGAAVRGLRDMAFEAAWNLHEGGVEGEQEMEQLAEKVFHDPREMARYQFYRRQSETRQVSLNKGFWMYSQRPLEQMIEAIVFKDSRLEGMAFPTTKEANWINVSPDDHFGHRSVGYNGRFLLNDTAYLIKNMESLARALPADVFAA